MSNLPRVAVVILSWNGASYLREFLPSVLRSSYPNLELIVADNDSSDESVSLLKESFPQVRLIQNGANLGFAAGYNKALKEVDADYYVLLNQDVEIEPGWIEPLVEALEMNPEIAAAQPKIRAYKKRNLFEYAGAAGGFIDLAAYPFCRGRLFDVVEEDRGQYDESMEIFWASGAALFIRSSVWHRFRGLDPVLFAHMEEIDLCWRIKRAGYSILSVPSSVVYHLGGGSLPMGHPHKTYLNFRNNLIIQIKNEKAGRLFWAYPLRLLLDGVAALRELLQGHWADFSAIARAHFYVHLRYFKWVASRRKTQRIIRQYRVAPDNEKGRYHGLLIVDFFISKKKYFSQLRPRAFER